MSTPGLHRTPGPPSPWERLTAWWGRQDTMFRLATFGRLEVEMTPHEPLIDPDMPGVCPVDGLGHDHPQHQRCLRERPSRRVHGDPAQERGWR